MWSGAGLAASLVVCLAVGCKRPAPPRPPEAGPPPPPANGPAASARLATPVATPQRLADGEPTDPFREVAPGLLARTRFVTDRTGAPAMEIWDLMVGPGRDASKARLPGAAIVQVRSGAGTLAIGGAAGSELHAGATLTIDEGAEIAVTNGDKVQPLMLRATIVRGAAR